MTSGDGDDGLASLGATNAGQTMWRRLRSSARHDRMQCNNYVAAAPEEEAPEETPTG